MSSLARQLEKLSVPYTQAVLGQDKRKASLLFDPQEAANLDKETIFALGTSGLEELETVDESFIKYESTLFAESSQTWERALQTKEVNTKLDAAISQFLTQLSPYFLLKSSMKALEWLVYRYHIHQFNIDELMLCVLPYHETKSFVRVIQLFKLDDPKDKWHWLHPCAKNGVPLPRAALVNHCKKDPGFLSFVCDIVSKNVKVHGWDSPQLRVVTSFFACTLLGVMQTKEDVNEKVVSIIVPHLVACFKSKSLDLKAAGYMIMSQLVVNTQLKPAVLKSLIQALTKKMKPALIQEALACLALVYQTQKMQQLSSKSFKHLCKIPGIVHSLQKLHDKFNISAFLRAWLDLLIPQAVKHGNSAGFSSTEGSDDFGQGKPLYSSILLDLLRDVRLEKSVAEMVTRCVLDKLISHRMEMIETEDSVDLWNETARMYTTTLERRYTDIFDKAVSNLVQALKGEQLDILQEVTSLTSLPLKYEVIEDTETNLILGLNHAKSSVRLMSVKQLVKGVQGEGRDDVMKSSAEFVQEALLGRLEDDNVNIVAAILELKQKLPQVVDRETLGHSLLKLVKNRVVDNEWSGVCQRAVQLLSSRELSDVIPDLAVHLLPLTMVLGGSKAISQTLLESHLFNKHPVIKRMVKGCQRALKENCGSVNAPLIPPIAEAVVTSHEEGFNMLETLITSCNGNVTYTVFVLCLLAEIVESDKCELRVKYVQHIVQIVQQLLQEDLIEYSVKGSSDVLPIDVWLNDSMTTEHIHIGVISMCLQNTIDFLTKQKFDGSLWLDMTSELSNVTMATIDVVCKQCCLPTFNEKWRQLLAYVKDNFPIDSLTKVSCMLLVSDLDWPAGSLSASPSTQVILITLVNQIWAGLNHSQSVKLLSSNSPVLPVLMVCLAHSQKAIRQGALKCLESIKQNIDAKNDKFKFLKKLCSKREEIITDGEFVIETLRKMLSTSDDSKDAYKTKTLAMMLGWLLDDTTPLPIVTRILYILSGVNNVNVLENLTKLGERLIKDLDSQPAQQNLTLSALEHVMDKYSPELAGTLTQDSEPYKFMVQSLWSTAGSRDNVCPQSIALKKITQELFTGLPDEATQYQLICVIIEEYKKVKTPAQASLISDTIKGVKMNASLLSRLLTVGDGSDVATVKEKKRTRTKVSVDPIDYPKIMLVLETLQNRKKLEDNESLVVTLFNLLSRLVNENHADVEYCKQLTLTVLNNLCSRWDAGTKPEKQESLSVEALIQCIRGSQSPQTQQQALLVMAAVAHLFPEYILHNVMSIFTFMGTSLLQQDDNHSLQVITRTVDTVIPALISAHKSSKGKESDLNTLICNILRVFIDARHHVPKHRIVLLFDHLLETLCSEQYLWMVIVLIVESSVRTKNVPMLTEAGTVEEGGSLLEKDIELLCGLCDNVDITVQIQSVAKVVDLLCQLITVHEERVANPNRVSSRGKKQQDQFLVIQHDTLSPQELRLTKYYTAKVIVRVFSRETFISEVLYLVEQDENNLTASFEKFICVCLAYLTKVAKCHSTHSAATTGRFWKALLAKIYEIIDKVNYVLPSGVFLDVISSLMKHEVMGVRRKALELLNTKLGQINTTKLSQSQVKSLLELVDKLVTMVNTELGDEPDSDVITSCQMALYSLKLLCKLLGTQHPKEFTKMFSLVVSIVTRDNLAPPILGSALLCLAELCASVKTQSIPYLPTFMPAVISVLNNKTLLSSHELVLICVLTVLQKLLTSLPHFLSKYLLDLLTGVCQLSNIVNTDDDEVSKKSQPVIRLKAVRHQLSTTIPARVMVPIIGQAYDQLLKANQASISSLLCVCKEHIENIPKEDLPTQQTTLVTFFCAALDLHNQDLKLTPAQSNVVEEHALDAVLALVVRLSENSFRPVFFKLTDWATREDTEVYRNRTLVFFRLCDRLAGKLRSLFNLFVTHIIKTACNLLKVNNTMAQEVTYFSEGDTAVPKSVHMLEYVMGCLHKCMLYDTDGFVDKEVFNLLMQPLIDQIENFLGTDEDYQRRITEYVTPCISQLAVASRDDALWKSLNYQVCLKTRHTSSKVRFATLSVIQDLANKLGDEYMPLLPESIPFLAELMEDESEEVELRCKEVVQELEELMGESLQKYF